MNNITSGVDRDVSFCINAKSFNFHLFFLCCFALSNAFPFGLGEKVEWIKSKMCVCNTKFFVLFSLL